MDLPECLQTPPIGGDPTLIGQTISAEISPS